MGIQSWSYQNENILSVECGCLALPYPNLIFVSSIEPRNRSRRALPSYDFRFSTSGHYFSDYKFTMPLPNITSNGEFQHFLIVWMWDLALCGNPGRQI